MIPLTSAFGAMPLIGLLICIVAIAFAKRNRRMLLTGLAGLQGLLMLGNLFSGTMIDTKNEENLAVYVAVRLLAGSASLVIALVSIGVVFASHDS